MRENRYLAHVADHLGMTETLNRLLDEFRERRVDGVIANWDAAIDDSLARRLNTFPGAVIVSHFGARHEHGLNADWVLHDPVPALNNIGRHLAAIGRRRPAFVLNVAANRFKADHVLATLGDLDHPPGTDPIIPVPDLDLRARLHECIPALLDNACPGPLWFDALLCATDDMAVAAMSWLRRRNIAVPREVAVIGFNNGSAAGYLDPPLASVERRDLEMTATAWELLSERLAEPDLPPRRRSVAMRFVHRESAGSPSAC